MPNSILSGQSGIYTRDGTATAGDILAGKTAYVNDVKITGNIPSLAAAYIYPGTADQVIGGGYYLAGAQTILGDPNLYAPYIKHGVTIFNTTGSYIGTVVTNVVEELEGSLWCPACGSGFGLSVTFSAPIYSLIGYDGQMFGSGGITLESGPIISGNTVSWTFTNHFYNSGADLDWWCRAYLYGVSY